MARLLMLIFRMSTQLSFLVTCGAVAAISCTVSPAGLGVNANEEDSAARTPTSNRAPRAPAAIDPVANDAGMAGPPLAPPGADVTIQPPPAMIAVDAGGPNATLADAGAAAVDDPPPAVPPPSPAATDRQVLRAHDIKAGRITARVVYAHNLTAAGGSAGLVLPPPAAPLLQLDLGSQDLNVEALVVDVLYAHDIKAGHIEIGETHASVKMTKGMETDD
jgi:hypothetical protein